MTKLILAAAGLAVASSASADLTSASHTNLLNPEYYTINATPVDGPDIAGVFGTAYSNMDAGPNGYVAFAAAGGYVGFDDYDSIGVGGTIDVATFRFVGGVQDAGGVAFFEFYDASSNFVDSFGVALTNPGNFIYTITITAYPGSVVVPEAGIAQMYVDGNGDFGPATTGQWFLGDAGPTVGTENVAFGGSNPFSHNFEINGDYVPAPATAALLGLGGLAATRRRR
ncbi:MAG: PEP-CTERM sorting domain-containing protein [Phycisphaerales bacterium]|nr:PEP-CTERM sorting domain-containing protein [Phycisphaerales bacterium]MCB9835589.1 PEP-CTERM sorting domain-containing protein [Phycisphaera sp.]